MQILLGADPEVFVRHNGIPVSAHGMIPGTKRLPYKVGYGAVQVDGHALEFNIQPAESEVTFLHNIHAVFSRLEQMIPAGHRLDISPSIDFDWSYLKSLPPEANELGCDPDFDAYSGNANERPNGETNMRTAAGHIHIGWTQDEVKDNPEHLEKCRNLVKQLDFFLGIPSVLLDPDTRRRNMYGKAGAFRPKPYGVEYRVLSNFWLKDDKLTAWVYKQTHLAIKRLMEGEVCFTQTGEFYPGAIINTSDRAGVKQFKEKFPNVWGMIDTFEELVEN